MPDNIVNGSDMFHSSEIMDEYSDTSYSVRSGDKVVSEEVTDQAADGECRGDIFLVPRRRIFDVRDCLARLFLFLNLLKNVVIHKMMY